MRAAIKLVTISDQDGMDSISMGVSIGYAMNVMSVGSTDSDFACPHILMASLCALVRVIPLSN